MSKSSQRRTHLLRHARGLLEEPVIDPDDRLVPLLVLELHRDVVFARAVERQESVELQVDGMGQLVVAVGGPLHVPDELVAVVEELARVLVDEHLRVLAVVGAEDDALALIGEHRQHHTLVLVTLALVVVEEHRATIIAL